MVAPKCGGQ
jgi:WD40 repeat protein